VNLRKDGPKRLRRTRRELPNGQVSQWMADTNFKREREARRAGLAGGGGQRRYVLDIIIWRREQGDVES
jgi:hypothetical protein